MKPHKIHVDFETRSACDLKTAGAHKYAKHPTTDILCIGVAVDDDAPQVYRPLDIPELVLKLVASGATVVAHNSPFELAIWNSVGIKRYGWPRLDPHQTDCTMARAYAMSLPGSLDGASAAVGIEHRKDMAGHRLMMKMSQPRSTGDDGAIVWWEDPEQFERLFAYCAQDIVVERELDKRLKPLSASEKRVWLLDYEINCRGIYVDVEPAKRALEIVEWEQERLNLDMREVTGNQVATFNANAALKKWLLSVGVDTPGVAKNDIVNLFARADLPPIARKALEIRKEAAKSSTAKLKAMVLGACDDGRMRGIFQYHGASTGRWAGRRVQPQNFPRPTLKQREIDHIFSLLAMSPEAALAYMEIFCSSPMTAVSDCLRGFLRAAPGKKLIALDWSAIEARILSWLAGEHRVLDIFRSHGKIYEAAAADIFGVLYTEITKDDWRRQVGKVSDLALGYQGGVGAFQAMAKVYGVKMAPALGALWEKATTEQRERAFARWKSERKKTDIPKQEFLASELTKLAWRESHPNIVNYWANVEAAATAAVRNPGQIFEVTGPNIPKVLYRTNGSFLWCKLPSGRSLCYPYPKLQEHKTPWNTKKEMLTYMAEDSLTRKWERTKAYGGLLVENITQAAARDLLAETMVALDNNDWRIVLHVHDEIVVETTNGSFDEAAKIVRRVPAWAKGLPVGAEGWEATRFRK